MCKISHGLLFFGVVISLGFTNPATAQLSAPATAITYQGYLQNSSAAADGIFCFEFQLFDAESAGTAVSPVLQPCNVAVQNGRFSVELDFGADAFNGEPRWLEIKVVNGGNTTALSPRQKVNPAPTALHALKADHAATAAAADNGVPSGSSVYSPVYPPPAGYTFGGSVLTMGIPSWTAASAFTDPIGLFPVVGVINNKAYVASGKTLEYDLVTKAVAVKKAPLSYRTMSGSAVLNNKLYQVGGGFTSPSDVVTAYDPSKDSWASLTKLPAMRNMPAVASAGGKLYAFGGDNGTGTIYNTAYAYDPTLNTWANIATMPQSVSGVAATVGNQIHVIGLSQQTGKAHLVYDIATNNWATLPQPTAYIAGASCVALGQRIHLIGGSAGVGGGTNQYLKTHSIYDVSTQTWVSGIESLRLRMAGGAASIDPGHFIYVGGNENSQSDDSAIDIYNAGDSILYLHTRQ